jgi:ribosomal protein S18 acetylase RimI-like enzyme
MRILRDQRAIGSGACQARTVIACEARRAMHAPELLDALELGSLATPMVPGKTWRADIAGVFVRESAMPSPRSNQVALARLRDDEAASTVQRVRDHFGARPFGWNVGPRSTPTDLERHLAAIGMTMARESAGMVLDDLGRAIDAPQLAIRRATLDDAPALAAMGVAMFGQDPTEAAWLQQLVLADPRLEVSLVIDADEIVGFGTCFHAPARITLLVGAAVLPHARGRGVYRALLRHRIATGRAAGSSCAIIQANDETSAPICRKAGFVEACRLRYWTTPTPT